MFPKDKKIPRKLFPLFLHGAKTLKNNLFFVRFKYVGGHSNRFSFSVSKKTSKSAVVRNRLRRMGYRVLKDFLPQIKSNTFWNFSFLKIPKTESEVRDSISFILKESKMIK